jgi:hypothetical protein
MMPLGSRSLDELYWDTHCTNECGCTNLKQALQRHPELRRDGDGDGFEEKPAETGEKHAH